MGEVKTREGRDLARQEILTLNLDSGIAILSFEYSIKIPNNTAIMDQQAPLSSRRVGSLKEKFGADVSVVTAYFSVYGSTKVIDKLEVKRAGGVTEQEKLDEKNTKEIAGVRDELFRENNKVLEPGESRSFINTKRSMPQTHIEGTVTDLETGRTRPMTKEELEKFTKETYRRLYEELSPFYDDWLMVDEDQLDKEIIELLKKIMRNRFFDNLGS